MASKQQKICAVCMKIFGERSSKVQNVTSAIAELIREYIWPYYDTTKACCPPYICCSCKTNLYALGRGDTAKLSAWLNILTQVMIFNIYLRSMGYMERERCVLCTWMFYFADKINIFRLWIANTSTYYLACLIKSKWIVCIIDWPERWFQTINKCCWYSWNCCRNCIRAEQRYSPKIRNYLLRLLSRYRYRLKDQQSTNFTGG